MNKATVIQNQTCLDILLQEAGSIELGFQILIDNDLSITGDLSAGTELKNNITDAELQIVNFYQDNLIKPATGFREVQNTNQTLFETGLFETGLFA